MTEQTATETGAEWFIVHTYSGQEDRVKRNLEMRIESMDVKDKIFQVIVPTEDEIEIKDGKRKNVQRKIFPGYILVQMTMDDQSWYVVRNTPGVTGFVSAEDERERRPKPVPRPRPPRPASHPASHPAPRPAPHLAPRRARQRRRLHCSPVTPQPAPGRRPHQGPYRRPRRPVPQRPPPREQSRGRAKG